MGQPPAESERRMVYLVATANADGVKPNEYVRRTIQSAVQRGTLFIQEGHGFVVMGYDGFDHDFFPCGSGETVEEAREIAQAKKGEEHLYSSGDDISTTFHIFTREGVPVPLVEPEATPVDPVQTHEPSIQFKDIAEIANTLFSRIDPELENERVLANTLVAKEYPVPRLPTLSAIITDKLRVIRDAGGSVWENQDLQGTIVHMEDLGRISLPKDLVERERWIALLLITAAQERGLAYGKLIIPPDYLPEDSEEFGKDRKVYGDAVLDKILERRTFTRAVGELNTLEKEINGEIGIPVVQTVINMILSGHLEQARIYASEETDKLRSYPAVVKKLDEILDINRS
jgi:hypothetical protein